MTNRIINLYTWGKTTDESLRPNELPKEAIAGFGATSHCQQLDARRDSTHITRQ